MEMAVFYLLLAAWARPRDGAGALLPLLACLALPLAFTLRSLLDTTTVDDTIRLLASGLAALAWALTAARLCAPAEYWQADDPRLLLLLGEIFGGRQASGLQPLAFWASLLLWWRGHLLPSWQPGLEEALSRFRLACLSIGVVIGLAAAVDRSGEAIVQLEQVAVLAAFFAAALLTTGLARRREMAGGAPPAPTLGGQRAPGVAPASPVGGLLASLLLVGGTLLALGAAAWGADWLSPAALAPAVALGGRALEALGHGLLALFGLLGSLLPHFTPPTTNLDQPAGPQTGLADRLPVLPPEAFAWLGPLLLLVAMAGAVGLGVLLAIAARQALKPDVDQIRAVDGGNDDSPAPIAPRGPVTILALMTRLLRALFRRSRLRPPLASASTIRESADPALLSIRAAYRAFLAWTARRGWARRSDETPDEFRRRLAELCPEAGPEAALLTGLYVAARYGGQPCPPADLRRAELALKGLETKRGETPQSR